MGGGGTHRDAGGSLELSSQQSFPSCRYDITADVLGSPVSLGVVFVSLWARAPATPPQQMGGVGAPIHQFLEIPLVLASCSINLLVKILPYGANKKRGCLFSCSFPNCQNLQLSGPGGLEMWALGYGDPVSAD